MFGITNIIGGLISVGVWVINELAAKWGYKVALVGAIVAVYAAAWAAIGAVLVAITSMVPTSPLISQVFQFLPSHATVVSAGALYYGTMATLKAWDYFRMVAGVAAKVAA